LTTNNYIKFLFSLENAIIEMEKLITKKLFDMYVLKFFIIIYDNFHYNILINIVIFIIKFHSLINYLNSTFGPSEDLARDTLLSHKILMHSWVEPRHFDLPDFDFHIFEKAGNGIKLN